MNLPTRSPSRLLVVLALVALLAAVSGTGAHGTPALGAAAKPVNPTATPKPTNTPRPTNTPKATSTPKKSPTATTTSTPTNTPVPTNTPTNTPVPTDTPTDTPVPTDTAVVQDSLLAYWNFDDDACCTAADVSGNGYNLSLPQVFPYTPTWTTDTPPLAGDVSAITFDGASTDAFNQTAINLIGKSFSVAMWVKRARIGAETFFSQGMDAGTDQVLHLGFRASDAFFCGFYNDDLDTSTTITDTKWHHYTCTFDESSGSRKAYVDGTLVGSDVASGPYVGHSWLYFGQLSVNRDPGFAGSVDDARVYGVPLSDAAVAALAQGSPVPTPTPGGPTPTVTPTSVYCAVQPDFQPAEGVKIPQLLQLDATGSTSTCGVPQHYEWLCQSDTSTTCPQFETQANDGGKYDDPTPVLDLGEFDNIDIKLIVCAQGSCAPPVEHVYVGAAVNLG